MERKVENQKIYKKVQKILNNSGVAPDLQKYVMYLVERVLFFRNRANISASELSMLIDQSASYISKFESVGFNIPCSVILKICEVLEISPSEFFADDYKNYAKNQELKNLIERMPAEERNRLIDYLSVAYP